MPDFDGLLEKHAVKLARMLMATTNMPRDSKFDKMHDSSKVLLRKFAGREKQQ